MNQSEQGKKERPIGKQELQEGRKGPRICFLKFFPEFPAFLRR